MTDESSCSIYPLYDALGHLCVVLTVQGFIPVSAYYPDSIIILSDITCVYLYPVPSQSCDPLEDLLPSSSQYGFSSALPDDEDVEFFDDRTLGFTFIIGEFLFFSYQLSPIG